MTTIETTQIAPGNASATSAQPARSTNALSAVGAWITTSDHKRLGRMMFGIGPVSYTHLTLPTNREV